MAHKIIEGTAMRVGTHLMLDGSAHEVKKMDISKTGKHGHAKVRYEAVNIVTGKKKVAVVPGHERFEVPLIEKKKGQVLSIMGDNVSLMDLETYENFELPIPEDLKEGVKDGVTIEYWDVEGEKFIKRVL